MRLASDGQFVPFLWPAVIECNYHAAVTEGVHC